MGLLLLGLLFLFVIGLTINEMTSLVGHPRTIENDADRRPTMITLLLGMTLLASNPTPVYIDKPPIHKRWEPQSVKNRRAVEGWLEVPKPSPELRKYLEEKREKLEAKNEGIKIKPEDITVDKRFNDQ